MDRRDVFKGMLVAGGVVAAAKVAQAQAGPSPNRVVYHLPENDRVLPGLVNIHNHYLGMGGPEHVHIALVALGSGLKSFVNGKDDAIAGRIERLQEKGIELWACANTLRSMYIDLDQLLPGFQKAEQGGVVKVAELQSQGWCYIRA